MTENKGGKKFDNQFHRRYVGGEGEVEDRSVPEFAARGIRPMTYEQVLQEYRAYVGDPKAELPEEILESLRLGGKI